MLIFHELFFQKSHKVVNFEKYFIFIAKYMLQRLTIKILFANLWQGLHFILGTLLLSYPNIINYLHEISSKDQNLI